MPRHHAPGVRRDHGRLRHFSYVKPLRRKHRRSSYRITDARHFAAVRGARTRLERATFIRIVELLPGGLERCTEKFAIGLHAILNDVL